MPRAVRDLFLTNGTGGTACVRPRVEVTGPEIILAMILRWPVKLVVNMRMVRATAVAVGSNVVADFDLVSSVVGACPFGDPEDTGREACPVGHPVESGKEKGRETTRNTKF